MRSKTRLTITLSPDVLERLDRHIERSSLRNRSQAIEALLRQGLERQVRTAVILAGGEHGSDELPALAPVGGRSLISHTVEHLRRFGIRTCYILAGAHEFEIRQVVGRGDEHEMAIRYVREGLPQGTAGALKLVEQYIGNEPFLVIHGDVLTDIDLRDLADFHRTESALATIAVKPRESRPRYGQVMLQGSRITDFFESSPQGGFSIVNTGVYLFEPAIFDYIPEDRKVQLETEVFPRLAAAGDLVAFLFQGIWYDISTPEAYRQATRRWQQKGG